MTTTATAATRFTSPVTLKRLEAAGEVEAAFSVFGLTDSEGDQLVPGAFKDGQQIPMVWAHSWDKPVGRGVVRVEHDKAVFAGRFFTETEAGQQAYLTTKAMADLQEWSFGFRTLDTDRDTATGARVITALELYEVSPVLVGANRATRTLSIKAKPPASAVRTPRPAAPPDPALVAIRDQLRTQRRAELERIRAAVLAAGAREAEQRARSAGVVAAGHAVLARYAHVGLPHRRWGW